MSISRRAFLKYCIGSSALISLDAVAVGKLSKLMAGTEEMPTVIWLEGSSCSGCTISLTNLIGADSDDGPADVADLLINYINVAFGKTLMSAAGEAAVGHLRSAQEGGDFILVVEGGIPTAFNGMACTVMTENGIDISMKEAVEELAPMAQAVICVGACACYGGIPGGDSNPTQVSTVAELTGISTLNIPGCPPHPDWIAGSLAAALCGDIPAVDSYGRPSAFYGKTVHSQCPRKPQYELGRFAQTFGEEGSCMASMGCNGPGTHADCSSRGWNNGLNYCMQSNANCIGCTESDFSSEQLIYRD